jgi:hypothetical protein
VTHAQLAPDPKSAPRPTAGIRPFVEADIPHVANVHRAAFRIGDGPGLAAYRDYFSRVFLDNPAAGGRIASLVHQEHDGRITGFVGLVPRQVAIGGRRYQAVVSSQFIVDPASHVGLVALRLAKAYLEGPQDLSIADEANEVSRKLWEGLGGTTALLLSMYWTRALRPARLALSYVRERRVLAPFAVAAAPLAMAADALVTRAPGSQFRQSPPVTTGEPCGPAVLAPTMDCCGADALRVEYDAPTFQWLLDRAATRTTGGRLLSAVVRDGSAILGWYIAHLDRDGVAEVAQLAASPSSVDGVLDHLFYAAWQHGAVSVSGRLDPRFMQALSDKYCLFHRRGPWVLIKSNKPELLQALRSGASCLSRFDGEWSLRLQPVTR